MLSQNTGKSEAARREEEILKFWQASKIFEKTLEKPAPKGKFVFYEGPPTANAKPALHHLEARAFKDVIPRFKTMQGYHVPRRGGWDTHGLPVELQIEKKLGLNSKKAIEEYGIEKFNAECKESVFEYIKDWEDFTDRIGFWMDKENAYFTFNTSYIESLWNVFAEVNKKGLLYKDYKVVPWCPRCGTTLSSHELAQGYEDVKDLSVFIRFKIKDLRFKNTSLLAWTTTPWTLPGNVALAVGKDIDYIKVKVGEEILILAKARAEILPEDYEIVETMKGSDLVGLSYEPLYNFIKPNDKSHKVYTADFVTTEDGTGIVHTAVMYGADDFELGTKVGLPKEHLVGLDGKFLPNTGFLSGRFVMEKDVNGKPTLAVDIINDLTARGLFFGKKNYEHTYPHCWRCKTPLIYYARDSWYIAMSKLRDKLVSENQKINWEPAHIRDGRFGEWLREIKDWAISRERYWGTPMPVWVATQNNAEQTQKGAEMIVVDSIETLKKYTRKSGNKYFVMRHGETDGNHKDLVDCDVNSSLPVNIKGIKDVKKAVGTLKGKKIGLIISSDFLRTKETSEIIKKELGLSDNQIIFDKRLREFNIGEYNGKTWKEFSRDFPGKEHLDLRAPGGESRADLKRRVSDFIYEIEEKYKDKTILIVGHGAPIRMIFAGARGLTARESIGIRIELDNAEIRELNFIPLPHNQNYELDLHRPFIDDIVLEKGGKTFKRVKDVMDVWFDSGAMPFAQDHYPFEGGKPGFFGGGQKLSYPADFISEAIDQTRGWFYTLHAVGNLMGKGRAYKNVICLGHILDAQGKKMSKSIGNIVNPWEMMDKYGVDTLRLWMYSVNQPGESKNFDEKTVAELHNKVFNLLYNVLAFYELYRDKKLEVGSEKLEKSKNVLDIWIMERFKELTNVMTESLEKYKLLEPVRAMRDFIDDLSTWYLRRSRDRLKDGDMEAKVTLYFILKEFSKLLAPFAPFSAEDIWQKLKTDEDVESVHLASWPKTEKVHSNILTNMRMTRELVTLGLEARQKAGIKVRQPLKKLEVGGENLEVGYLELIKEELNVKEVIFGKEFKLDTEITGELKREGDFREFLRTVQGLRKDMNLSPSDMINLVIPENQKGLITGFEDELKKVAGIKEIKFSGAEIKIEK